ncbi:MAG: cytochrome c biogenesis protein ResB [Acidobacteriota bacterium]|nr:cytochrome c biogenesis protein ResB [Acidobacteriota bacterium]
MRSLIRFFSSLRLAIVLIILLAAASVLGTLIPQGRTLEEYAVRYGGAAGILVKSGLTGLYHAAGFLALLILLGLNIAVCTLTRLPGKLRRAFRPRLETEAKALAGFKIHDRLKRSAPLAEVRERLETAMREAGWRVRSESRENRVHILARKRTAGLFGSDIVHLGLLVLLAGGIVTAAAGFRTELALSEGLTLDVPKAGFALRLDKFDTEYHPDGSVKAWKSSVTVLEAERPVRQAVIAVNHPLTHRGYSFYQMSYGDDWDATRVTLAVRKKDDPAPARPIILHPGRRLALGDAAGSEIELKRFLPDFVLGEGNRPENRSYRPDNPAALVEIRGGGETAFEGWVFANYPGFAQAHGREASGWEVGIKAFDAPRFSVLEAAKDPGVPLIWIGCLLGMAGLFLAFYWPAREIRAGLEEANGRTDIGLGGTAAKGRDRLQAEFTALVESLRRPT